MSYDLAFTNSETQIDLIILPPNSAPNAVRGQRARTTTDRRQPHDYKFCLKEEQKNIEKSNDPAMQCK